MVAAGANHGRSRSHCSQGDQGDQGDQEATFTGSSGRSRRHSHTEAGRSREALSQGGRGDQRDTFFTGRSRDQERHFSQGDRGDQEGTFTRRPGDQERHFSQGRSGRSGRHFFTGTSGRSRATLFTGGRGNPGRSNRAAQAVHLALAVLLDGSRDTRGIWSEQTEGSEATSLEPGKGCALWLKPVIPNDSQARAASASSAARKMSCRDTRLSYRWRKY
jgi:hypothetical protein